MKKILKIILLTNFISNLSFGQSLKSPIKLNNKAYYYVSKKTYTSKAEPEEGKTFTVPKNTVWLVSVDCGLCYLRSIRPCSYITNEQFNYQQMNTDGNISWSFLPVVLFSETSFVLHSNSLNSLDNIIIEEYKIRVKK